MGTLVKWILVGIAAYLAWQWLPSVEPAPSEADIQQLAANVREGEVLIYTTTTCPYCAQAKSWMAQYGFRYTECDAEAKEHCARELESLGANGVPYVIVRGHHMKDGFDSDQFLTALK